MKPKSVANEELRPLSARSLKSVIDSIRPILAEASVLDLYAGQGRFGIECLKERAHEVWFVENHRKTAQALEVALEKYYSSRTWHVRGEETFHFLERQNRQWDIIFCDPPFPDWNETFAQKLTGAVRPRLGAGGLWLVKYPTRSPALLPEGFGLKKESVFGESRLLYFEPK